MALPSAKTTFRTLLVLAWLIPTLNFDGFDRLARFGSLSTRLPQHLYFAESAASLILSLAATVGLWFFQRWARIAYVIAVPIYIYLVPLGWIVTGATYIRLVAYLGAAIEGAIVAMSFLPPLANMFAKRQA
jgi:hypothetical protein